MTDVKKYSAINLDKTYGLPGGSNEENMNALIGSIFFNEDASSKEGDNGEGLVFSKENIEKTIDDIVDSKDTKDLLRWLGLAGGKRKLLDLLSGVTKNYQVSIPDEFFSLLDEASKEWQAVPEDPYVKTRPWSTASLAEGVEALPKTLEDTENLIIALYTTGDNHAATDLVDVSEMLDTFLPVFNSKALHDAFQVEKVAYKEICAKVYTELYSAIKQVHTKNANIFSESDSLRTLAAFLSYGEE